MGSFLTRNIAQTPQTRTKVKRVHAALDNDDVDALFDGCTMKILLPRFVIGSPQPGTQETVYHKCAKLQYSDNLRRLLDICYKDMGVGGLTIVDAHNATPLLVAVCYNRVWFLEYFLEQDKFVFTKTTTRNLFYNGIFFPASSTLLHTAVRANKPDVIKFLLDRRYIGLLQKDDFARTPVELALTLKDQAPDALGAFTDYDAIIAHLLHEASGFYKCYNSSHGRCISEAHTCFKILLEHGASVNGRLRVPPGFSPLHGAITAIAESVLCCESIYNEIMRQLLEAGTDVNITDDNGITPLHRICSELNDRAKYYDRAFPERIIQKIQQLLEVMWLLILAGCEPRVKCDEGLTPATTLALGRTLTKYGPLPGHTDALCILLALGDTISLADPERMVALEGALLKIHDKKIKFIVETGFKFQHVDVIRMNGHCDVSDYLLRMFDQPQTLKRLAANFIRLRLQPNPFVGVKKLSLPPGFDRSYITIMRERDENFQIENHSTMTNQLNIPSAYCANDGVV